MLLLKPQKEAKEHSLENHATDAISMRYASDILEEGTRSRKPYDWCNCRNWHDCHNWHEKCEQNFYRKNKVQKTMQLAQEMQMNYLKKKQSPENHTIGVTTKEGE